MEGMATKYNGKLAEMRMRCNDLLSSFYWAVVLALVFVLSRIALVNSSNITAAFRCNVAIFFSTLTV